MEGLDVSQMVGGLNIPIQSIRTVEREPSAQPHRQDLAVPTTEPTEADTEVAKSAHDDDDNDNDDDEPADLP